MAHSKANHATPSQCTSILLVMVVTVSFNNIYEVSSDVVEMRIVDEPTSYSWQNNNAAEREEKMKLRMEPSPFSGPEQLKRLYRRCFKKTLSKYEYEFCPFANITQKEVDTTTWNPYQGVLGVWQEWNIQENKFISMKMVMGEQCGANPRQAEIILSCGKSHEIMNVTEPRHCEYEVLFHTPLVCHQHSMLVYPTLNEALRHRWDTLMSELQADEITEKGYGVALHKLFQDAGLKAKPKDQNIPPQIRKSGGATQESKFTNLDICNAEYADLKAELERTKAQLQTQQT